MSDPLAVEDRPLVREAAERRLPMGIVQVIGWTIALGAVPPLLHNAYRGRWASAAVPCASVTERLLLRKDGTTVPVEMSSKRMPDGTYHSFFRDVTERRRAAERD